ncbi:MAG: hypothetical protein A4E49_03362 [Methanosaeta sp. PtaU1.Bin112]|nr:MAG: hypothetical protein A4E49_03362 [Methanosaeta sp. PtaU1.Bin112]
MEEIGELIGKGFGIWRSNLNLCIPFLLSIILSMILAMPVLAAFFVTSMPETGMNSTLLQNEEDMQELIAQMQGSLDRLEEDMILPMVALFLVLIIVFYLINAFFTAGAIGMARQALDIGKSDTGAMWAVGKRHFFNMFLANLLLGLLTLAGLIFILPALAHGATSFQSDSQAIGLAAVGLLLFILYALVLSVVLVTMPYALVIQELGPVQAVLASLNFFRYNKFDVTILWLVVAALSLGLQMIGGAITSGEANGAQLSAINGLVNLLVLAPLSNLWWTRLYMNRKGLLRIDEVRDPW